MNHCICMDDEQLMLLGFLAGIPLVLKTSDHKYGFAGNEVIGGDDLFCKVQFPHQKKLICCKEEDAGILERLAKNMVNQKTKFESIAKCLPIIQSVNMSEKIDVRDSICYLCLFSEDAPLFLKGMLKAFIGVACDEEASDMGEIKSFFENIIRKIKDLFLEENYRCFSDRFLRVIEQYVTRLTGSGNQADSDEEKRKKLHALEYPMEVFIKTTTERMQLREKKSSILSFIFDEDDGGYEEIIHLFRILEKIMNMFGEKFSWECKSFFAEPVWMPPHDFYDPWEQFIDAFRNRPLEEKRSVLRKMRNSLK